MNILYISLKMDKNIYKLIFYLLFYAYFESNAQIMFVSDFEADDWDNWENRTDWELQCLTPIDGACSLHHNQSPSLFEARINPDGVCMQFSEPLRENCVMQPSNYQLSSSAGAPIPIQSVQCSSSDSSCVCLKFAEENYSRMHLVMNNLVDTDGLPLVDNVIDFDYTPVPRWGAIVFNELMVDPTPVVHLPDGEFIELRNNADYRIDLKNWKLVVNNREKTLLTQQLDAGHFLIIGGTNSGSKWSDYGTTMEVTGLSLANDGVVLKLFSDNDVLIDSVSYTPSMQIPGFSDGGYSLERIDPLRSCNARFNWTTTDSENGGTPGAVNSVFKTNVDTIPPFVTLVKVVNNSVLEVCFSEKPDLISGVDPLFDFSPPLPNPDSICFDEVFLKYSIYFPSESFRNGEDYSLTINAFMDGCGNISVIDQRMFGFYIPKAGDVLINEVLFNPYPDGVDFVEFYNTSGRNVDASTLFLGSLNNVGEIKSFFPLSDESLSLYDGQYGVFTSDPEKVLHDYHSNCPECIFEMNKFPAFNQDEGWVVLYNQQMEIIDYFHYQDNMHHSLISNEKGISLERISFLKPTNDRANWQSAAESAGFATPGYENSVCISSLDPSDQVSFDPLVFSPNEDGINDLLKIKIITSGSGSWVNIRIFDRSGIEIYRLTNNELIGGETMLIWDGTDANHHKVGLGIYVIKVELFSLNSRLKSFKAACVVTDRLE